MAAASPGAIRAGRAFVELFADDSKLVRALKAAQTKLRTWGDAISSMGRKLFMAGVAIAAPLLAAAKVFAGIGGQLAHLSKRTGMSVESLSELIYAAEQCGVGTEGLEKALRKMQRTLAGADEESKAAVKTLGRLGLTIEDLQGLDPDKQLEILADRFARLNDPAKRVVAAMELFGRAGAEMIPLLAGGADEVRALRQEARDLGLVMSKEDAEAAHRLERAMEAVYRSIKATVAAVGSALAPMLTGAARRFLDLLKQAREWIKQNPELIQRVFRLAGVVTAAGAALIVFAKVFPLVASGIGLVIGACGVLATVLTWVLTPWGAIVTVILAGSTAIGGAAGAALIPWGQLFAWLKGKLLGAWELVGELLEGITNAFVGARFDLIWSLLSTAGQLAWEKVKRAGIEAWNAIATGVSDVVVQMIGNLAEAFWKAWYQVKAGFFWLLDAMKKGFYTLVYDLAGTIVEQLGGAFQSALTAAGQALKGNWLTEGMGQALEDAAAGLGARFGTIGGGLRARGREAAGRVDREAADRQAAAEQDLTARLGDVQAWVARQRDLWRARLGVAPDLAEEQRLQAEFDRLLQEARQAAQAAGRPFVGTRRPEEAPDILGELKSSVAGTFSAFAAGRMGGGPLDRLVEGQRRQLTHDEKFHRLWLQRLDRLAERMGVFD